MGELECLELRIEQTVVTMDFGQQERRQQVSFSLAETSLLGFGIENKSCRSPDFHVDFVSCLRQVRVEHHDAMRLIATTTKTDWRFIGLSVDVIKTVGDAVHSSAFLLSRFSFGIFRETDFLNEIQDRSLSRNVLLNPEIWQSEIPLDH